MKLFLFTLAVLAFASLTVGDQLPVRPKFNISNIVKLIKRFTFKPLILPVNRVTAKTKFVVPTTQPIIDANGKFTPPGELAKACILAEGNMFQKCQSEGAKNFNFSSATEETTVWESCCAAYQEISCYRKNAKTFCPKANLIPFLLYTKKVSDYFQGSLCKSMGFTITDWKNGCEKKTAELLQQAHQNDKYKGTKKTFSLPADKGPEKACMLKLRNSDNGKTNYEKNCADAAAKKYDPTNDKWTKTPIRDICYQTFDVIDCLKKQSLTTCTDSEQKDFDAYGKQCMSIFDSSLCANFTSKSYQDFLKAPVKREGKNDASSVVLNAFVAAIALFGGLIAFY